MVGAEREVPEVRSEDWPSGDFGGGAGGSDLAAVKASASVRLDPCGKDAPCRVGRTSRCAVPKQIKKQIPFGMNGIFLMFLPQLGDQCRCHGEVYQKGQGIHDGGERIPQPGFHGAFCHVGKTPFGLLL